MKPRGLTLTEAEALGVAHEHPDAAKLRPHKYGAVPTVHNGVRYASKAEAERAEWHDAQVRIGRERWWIGQPKFRLGVSENVYIADFLIVDASGVLVEDVKGFRTKNFKRNICLWRRYGPCPLLIVERGTVSEVIEPQGRKL